MADQTKQRPRACRPVPGNSVRGEQGYRKHARKENTERVDRSGFQRPPFLTTVGRGGLSLEPEGKSHKGTPWLTFLSKESCCMRTGRA